MPTDSAPKGWEVCSGCRGYGVVEGWNGDWCVATCDVCKGGGTERKRDAQGRFAAWRCSDDGH